ncbi:MAG TPA: DUF167 family protein [Candidatus Bathyarchaeia archaeon]|nr:DUF167 family protein [Candidatus Bathyarchaeia archaeon]
MFHCGFLQLKGYVLGLFLSSNIVLVGGKTMRVTEIEGGCIIDVLVKPRSREFKLVIEGDDIALFCTEEPVRGRVNKEIVKELSRLFHKQVEVVSGFSSKQKKLLVKGVTKKEVEGLLKSRWVCLTAHEL